MAFAEINIQEIIQEKKNNSGEFYNTWKKSEDEYRLIAEMIELRKQRGYHRHSWQERLEIDNR